MEFRFIPQEQQPTPTFTELHPDTRSALARKAGGISAAELLQSDDGPEYLGLRPEVAEWAEEKFTAAIEQWEPYHEHLSTPLATNVPDLKRDIPDIKSRLEQLYGAYQELQKERPSEYDILLVPYNDFEMNLFRLPKYLTKLRLSGGYNADDIPPAISSRMTNDEILQYDDKKAGGMSLKEHTREMVQFHGSWAILLVERGIDQVGKNQSDIRMATIKDGSGYLDFGLIEWFALTLQQGKDMWNDKFIMLSGSNVPTNARHLMIRGGYEHDENRFFVELQPASVAYTNTGSKLLYNPARAQH